MAFLLNAYNHNHPQRRVPIYRARSNPLDLFSDQELITMYRFPRHLIEAIVEECDLPEPENNRGQPISNVLKVCSALRFYATGDYR